MARKKQKRTAPRRRRRMGAASGKNDMMLLIGGVAGGALGKLLVNKLPDDIAGFDISKFKSAIPVVGGFLLGKSAKNPMLKAAGMGMVVVGGVDFVQNTGVLGYLEAPMIAAIENNRQMALSEAPYVAGTGSAVCNIG